MPWKRLTPICVLTLAATGSARAHVAAPAGWTISRTAPEVTAYAPPDLRPGETFSITLYPPEALGGLPLSDWLGGAAARASVLPGRVVKPLVVNAQKGPAVAGVGVYAAPDGTALGGLFLGVSAGGARARLMRVVYSARGDLLQRYQAEMGAISRALAAETKQDAREVAPAGGTDEAPAGGVTSPVNPAARAVVSKRPPWLTAPGRGVKPGQIAAVVHFYDVKLSPGGVGGLNTNVQDEAYLLLRDGTVHRGLPAPPDQLDAARSRRAEPENWGRWQRTGVRYLVSWAAGPFVPLRGKPALPGANGMRLQGRWGTGSSSASMAGSSYRLWGVTFTQDGRFVKDGSGGYGNSLFMQNGGQPTISSQYDDSSSSTGILGNSVTVAAGHGGTPASHRSGTYAISGYVMTLRYDDGRVERMPFFLGDAPHETLWFEGAQLARDDKK